MGEILRSDCVHRHDGETEVGELCFSKTVILVYNPVMKRFKMSCDMQIIVKIPKMVMKKNFFVFDICFIPLFKGSLLILVKEMGEEGWHGQGNL